MFFRWDIFGRTLLLNTFLVYGLHLGSQNKAVTDNSLESAERAYAKGNYLMALPVYKAEFKKDSTNKTARYKLGICYLHTRINHAEALLHLRECSILPGAEPEVFKYLGRAYMLNNRLDEAIACFQRYALLKPEAEKEANHFMLQCKNAQALMSLPASASFQNLGKNINSAEPDYLPLVNKDESILIFSSRRKENVGGKRVEFDGYRNSDIYYSELKNGKWASARGAGRYLNTELDEQAVGVNADGREIVVYIDHISSFGDLYLSKRLAGTVEFAKMSALDKNINSNIETSACISEDGEVMFFARHENLQSNSDLYICRKLPTGKWALPQKLPENINTEFNEESPFLSFDGESLYFSSDCSKSMGGFDLFRSKWNRNTNTFSDPENLGYPVNSTDDELSISVTLDNSLAYISAFRPYGSGDLDIYRLRFNDADPVSRVHTGYIFLGDTVLASQTHDVMTYIIASNVMTGLEYTFVPNSRTGRYVMTLSEGIYRIQVYAEGYETFEEELVVSDMGRMSIEYNRNILLRKKH